MAETAQTSKFSFETIFNPEIIADPYPLYRQLRETSPVLELPEANMVVLTRYQDVQTLLRDKRLGHDNFAGLSAEEREDRLSNPAIANLARTMLLQNPPDHTRLRALVVKAFDARRVEAMRMRIRAIANELIDEFLGENRRQGGRTLRLKGRRWGKIPMQAIAGGRPWGSVLLGNVRWRVAHGEGARRLNERIGLRNDAFHPLAHQNGLGRTDRLEHGVQHCGTRHRCPALRRCCHHTEPDNQAADDGHPCWWPFARHADRRRPTCACAGIGSPVVSPGGIRPQQ